MALGMLAQKLVSVKMTEAARLGRRKRAGFGVPAPGGRGGGPGTLRGNALVWTVLECRKRL